jgi:hypothetical protein
MFQGRKASIRQGHVPSGIARGKDVQFDVVMEEEGRLVATNVVIDNTTR